MNSQEEILKRAAAVAKQQQQQPAVMPNPSPMSVQVAQTRDQQGNTYVVLIVHHHLGQNVFHLEPDGAERIGEAIQKQAKVARTGLDVVGGM